MKHIFLLLILICMITGNSYSQPRSSLLFIIGYALPLGDMHGTFGPTRSTFTNNADSNTYFLKHGITVGVQGNYRVTRKSNVSLNFGIIYNYFNQNTEFGSGDSLIKIKYNQKHLTFLAGSHFTVGNIKSKLQPFVNGGFSASSISGDYNEVYPDSTKTLTLNSAFRFGVYIGGGLEIRVGTRVGFTGGLQYNIANLFGRKTEGDSGRTYSLNDDDAVINNIQYKKRLLTYLQIYGGINFYFGL